MKKVIVDGLSLAQEGVVEDVDYYYMLVRTPRKYVAKDIKLHDQIVDCYISPPPIIILLKKGKGMNRSISESKKKFDNLLGSVINDYRYSIDEEFFRETPSEIDDLEFAELDTSKELVVDIQQGGKIKRILSRGNKLDYEIKKKN